MGHESFMLLLRNTLGSLLRCLHGVEAQSQAILDTLVSIVTNSKDPSLPRLSRSPLSYDSETVKTELSDILSLATELGNSRISKIVSVRAEQHAQLKLREFFQYFEESWGFVVACEVLCRRMIVGFRGTLVSQSKAFLQAFHGKRLQDSAKLVEDEQWAQVEVSQRSQRIVDVIIESAVKDAAEVVFAKPSTVNGVANGTSPTPNVESPPPTANGVGADLATTGNAKYLKVEERTYYVVSATMQVLQLVVDYLKVIVNLPLMNMECMSRLVEFLKVCATDRFGQVTEGVRIGIQFAYLSGRPWCRRYALSRAEEHHRASLGSVPHAPSCHGLRSSHAYADSIELNSTGISIAQYYDFAHPVHPRNLPTPPQPETSCHAGRI
jgi:vacuolar protein sorting-associated protein 54